MTITDELPLGHVPDVPHWSENYCLTGYDYRTGIGYWMHIGTWMHDMSLWREIVFFMLPDGTVLMNRSFGCGDDSRGPAGPGLKLTLEEDGERWRFNYNGPVTAIPAADVNGDPPLNDPRTIERFRADLSFAGTAPVWKFDTVDNDTWGKFHIEQSGNVKGTFERGADVWQFDGHGYRDHSRGPRQLGDVRGECWLQIRFPEGDSVCVFQMWHGGEDTPGLNVARVIDRDGHIADGTVQESPRIRGFEDTQLPARLVVTSDVGEYELTCTPLRAISYSLDADCSHLTPGIPEHAPDWPVSVVNQPTLFETADGRRAEGWMERCFYRPDGDSSTQDQ